MTATDRPVLRAAEIEAWLATYLVEQMGVPEELVSPEAAFESYGLDSVDGVVMASALEVEFTIEVDPAIFLRNATLPEVYAELENEGIATAAGSAVRRQTWIACPSARRAASCSASPRVGWAWMVAATSSSRAPISSARPNAADSSETPAPTA